MPEDIGPEFRPWIIAVKNSGVMAMSGYPPAMLMGIVVALDEHDAVIRAIRRWPIQAEFTPLAWEAVPSPVRLQVVKVDC
jgi:hypothetical protein